LEIQTRDKAEEKRDLELENIVGNLLTAEYQVNKLRTRLTELVSGYRVQMNKNKVSTQVFKYDNKWYKRSFLQRSNEARSKHLTPIKSIHLQSRMYSHELLKNTITQLIRSISNKRNNETSEELASRLELPLDIVESAKMALHQNNMLLGNPRTPWTIFDRPQNIEDANPVCPRLYLLRQVSFLCIFPCHN
jgi:hypothetical protein